MVPSVHILGSRLFGGADHFYIRLLSALHHQGQTVTAVNRSASPVAYALQGEGIPQIHVPLANQWDFWSVWRIRQVIKRLGPCVVQTYMGRATRLTRLSPKSGAVHVARLGGFYKIDGYYRHAHAWIGNTRAICDYLVREGLPADRVHLIGNFVPDAVPPTPAERRELRADHRIPDEALVLFALGRMVAKKGFEDLLRAYASLPPEIGGRPLLLLLAGAGPEAPALYALAEQLNLGERIRWLGWLEPAPFYALSDLFVCPSRHEPLGNVILEAWSHGVPVLSTDTDGALELIEDGRTGLLVPASNPEALAQRMREALQASDADRTAMTGTAQALLRERFSRAAVVGAYMDLYARLMAERGV